MPVLICLVWALLVSDWCVKTLARQHTNNNSIPKSPLDNYRKVKSLDYEDSVRWLQSDTKWPRGGLAWPYFLGPAINATSIASHSSAVNRYAPNRAPVTIMAQTVEHVTVEPPSNHINQMTVRPYWEAPRETSIQSPVTSPRPSESSYQVYSPSRQYRDQILREQENELLNELFPERESNANRKQLYREDIEKLLLMERYGDKYSEKKYYQKPKPTYSHNSYKDSYYSPSGYETDSNYHDNNYQQQQAAPQPSVLVYPTCSGNANKAVLPIIAIVLIGLLYFLFFYYIFLRSSSSGRKFKSFSNVRGKRDFNDDVMLDGPTWLSMVHELWEQDDSSENMACIQETLCRMNRLAMGAPGQAGWAVSLSSLPLSYLLHARHTGGFTSYIDAALMGRSGANCTELYSSCPRLHY